MAGLDTMCAVRLRLGPLLVAVAVLGCATVVGPGGRTASADAPRPERREPSETSPAKPALRGLATYYSDKLAGRKTASGERYDPDALTAAHRTLPFGTWVDVTRTNGRQVRVRITDRGPFGDEKRIIDVSKRAARDLDMLRAGVVEVTLRVVDEPR